MKKLIFITIILSLIMWPLGVWAHGDEPDNHSMMEGGENYMMGWNNLGMGLGGGWVGLIFMILFWGLIIWLVITLIQRSSNQAGSTKNKSALDTLKDRYARGEIDQQEFKEKKKDLIE